MNYPKISGSIQDADPFGYSSIMSGCTVYLEIKYGGDLRYLVYYSTTHNKIIKRINGPSNMV